MDEQEKANLGGMKKLGIDLGSGITAGAAAAILSHVSRKRDVSSTVCTVLNTFPRLIVSTALYSRPTRCSRPSIREPGLKDRCINGSSRSAGNSDSAGSGRVSDPGSVRCTSICSSARGILIVFDTLRVCVHVVMTAGLVTGQFLIYGWIKEALNAPPGVEIHKEEK
jgi:hypothetical protein